MVSERAKRLNEDLHERFSNESRWAAIDEAFEEIRQDERDVCSRVLGLSRPGHPLCAGCGAIDEPSCTCGVEQPTSEWGV